MGRWRLTLDGEPIELGGREQRLTALLGLRGTRTRAHVAGTLWPDTSEERALTSLRAAALRTRRAAPGLLESRRTTIGLDDQVSVDVHELVRWTNRVADLPVDQAVGLLGRVAVGELLPGWYDDWAILERARLEQLRLRGFERLARRALDAGALAEALDAAREAIQIEPLLESVRVIAIRAHLMAGNRVDAIREFDAYRQELEVELGVAPSPELVDLVRPLVASRLSSNRPQRPSTATAAVPPPRSPAREPRANRDSQYG